MDDDSGLPPVGIQHGGRNLWRRTDIQSERPERVSTVHEDVSHAEGFGGIAGAQALVSRLAESIGKLLNGYVTELFGRLAH